MMNDPQLEFTFLCILFHFMASLDHRPKIFLQMLPVCQHHLIHLIIHPCLVSNSIFTHLLLLSHSFAIATINTNLNSSQSSSSLCYRFISFHLLITIPTNKVLSFLLSNSDYSVYCTDIFLYSVHYHKQKDTVPVVTSVRDQWNVCQININIKCEFLINCCVFLLFYFNLWIQIVRNWGGCGSRLWAAHPNLK